MKNKILRISFWLSIWLLASLVVCVLVLVGIYIQTDILIVVFELMPDWFPTVFSGTYIFFSSIIGFWALINLLKDFKNDLKDTISNE